MFLIHVPFIIVLLFAYAIIGQWSIKKVAIHLIFKGPPTTTTTIVHYSDDKSTF